MLLERIYELEAQQPWIKTGGLPVAHHLLPHVQASVAEGNLTRTESIDPAASYQGTVRTRGGQKRGIPTCRLQVTTHLYAVVQESEDEDSSPGEDDDADGDYAPPRKMARHDNSPEPVRRSSRPKRVKKDVLDVPDPSPRRSRVPRKQRADVKAEAVTTTTQRTHAPPSFASSPRPADSVPGPSTVMAMNPYMTYYSPNTVSPTTPAYALNPYFFTTTPSLYPPQPPPSQPHPPPLHPPPPHLPRISSDIQRQAKPKRLKAHTVVSRSFNIPTVPRDKNGKPMLPLNVGIMTVISLGEICTREHFHTERYIFPVGYEVTRYSSPPASSNLPDLITDATSQLWIPHTR